MKRTIIFLLLLLSQHIFSLTLISSDTTFSGNITLTDSIEVKDSTTLTILPGTVIKADSAVQIFVKGVIKAQGTPTDSIIFTALDPNKPWAGIRMSSANTADTSLYEYSTIEYASKHYGAGIEISRKHPVHLNHCTIQNNNSDSYDKSEGGGMRIVSGAQVTLNACAIIKNSLTGEGGAGVWIDGSGVTMDSCLIASNKIITGFSQCNGAGVSANHANLLIKNSVIEKNSAAHKRTVYGVGLYLNNTKVDIFNSDISRNTALYTYGAAGAKGVAIYAYLASPLIENCTISENRDYSKSVRGYGSVYIEKGSTYYVERDTAIIRNSTISDNIFLSYGASALYVDDNDVQIEKCTITNNSSETDPTHWVAAAGLNFEDCTPYISTDTHIRGNLPSNGNLAEYIRIKKDTTFSGEVYHTGFTIDTGVVATIEKGTVFRGANDARIVCYGPFNAVGTEDDSIYFTEDEPGKTWGGIYLRNPDGTINATTFSYCALSEVKSSKSGSGLSIADIPKVTVTHCTFYENGSMNHGFSSSGALSISSSNAVVEDCDFVHNTASWNGAALSIYSSSSNSSSSNSNLVKNCNFVKNALFNHGSIIDVDAAIDSCVFSYNELVFPLLEATNPNSDAQVDGMIADFTSLTNSRIVDNIVWADSSRTINSSCFTVDEDKTIENCSFARNRVYRDSVLEDCYEVYIEKESEQLRKKQLVLKNCLFEKGIHIKTIDHGEVDLTLSNCTIAGKLAYEFNGDQGIVDLRINSTIIAGGIDSSGTAGTYRANINYSNIQDLGYIQNAMGNIAVDPQFVNVAKSDYRLQSTSPCINSGAGGESSYDLMGNPRKVGVIDMGAYEYNGSYYPIITAPDTIITTFRVFTQKFTYTTIDPDGDDVSVTIKNQPANYSASIKGDTIILEPKFYVPLGNDFIKLQATDETGRSTDRIITFETVNLPPKAKRMVVPTQDTITVAVPLYDPDGFIAYQRIVESPKNGWTPSTRSDTSFYYIHYVPYSKFKRRGIDSLLYYVKDKNGAVDTAQIFFVWDPVNRDPGAADVFVETTKNSAVTAAFNAWDLEDESLEFSIVDSAMNGSVVLRNDSLTYTPDKDFTGNDTLIYIAVDDSGATSNSAFVIITIDTETAVERIKETGDDVLFTYPNPVVDELHIKTAEEGSIIIVDANGSLVQYVNQFDVDVSHLDDGVYYVILKRKDGKTSITSFCK